MTVESGKDPVLWLLAAGDTVYVFDGGDDRIATQELVCIGASLDTERHNLLAHKWPEIAEALRKDGIEIVDCRRPAEPS